MGETGVVSVLEGGERDKFTSALTVHAKCHVHIERVFISSVDVFWHHITHYIIGLLLFQKVFKCRTLFTCFNAEQKMCV